MFRIFNRALHTNEEKVDIRREQPMTAFVCVRAETPPDCIGEVETLDICMGVAQMLYACTVVAETPPDHNRMAGIPPLGKKK